MDFSLAAYINLFLGLTPKEKKLIRELFRGQSKHGSYFVRSKYMCQNVDCHTETRKRLKRKNASTNHLMFVVNKRFDTNGRQKSDEYILDKNFFKAIQWLDLYYGLTPPKNKFNKILQHAQKENFYETKCSPPPLKNVPPRFKISIRDYNIDSPKPSLPKIHPEIAKMNIPEEEKVFFSQNSEAVIQRSIETLKFVLKKKEEIEHPVKFFCSLISKERKRKCL